MGFGGSGGSGGTIGAASDVAFNNPANNEVLTYNNSVGKWQNKSLSVSLPDATSSAKGGVQLAGDLGGTAASPTVAKVNGVAVTGTPSSGQVITATSTTAASWTDSTLEQNTDVNIQSLALGQALVYTSNATWQNVSNVANVKAFGAVGAGNSWQDDTAAIQAAINSVATSGGIVFFPPGRYTVTPTSSPALTVPSNVTLMGAGIGATELIKNADGILLDFSGVANTPTEYQSLRDISLKGNSHTGYLVKQHATTGFVGENVLFSGNADTCVDCAYITESSFNNYRFDFSGSTASAAPNFVIEQFGANPLTNRSEKITCSNFTLNFFKSGAISVSTTDDITFTNINSYSRVVSVNTPFVSVVNAGNFTFAQSTLFIDGYGNGYSTPPVAMKLSNPSHITGATQIEAVVFKVNGANTGTFSTDIEIDKFISEISLNNITISNSHPSTPSIQLIDSDPNGGTSSTINIGTLRNVYRNVSQNVADPILGSPFIYGGNFDPVLNVVQPTVTQQILYNSTIAVDPLRGSNIDVYLLTGNITIANPVAAWPGAVLTFRLRQDSPGNRTVTWGNKFKTSGTISGTAGSITMISFLCDGYFWIQTAKWAGL